MHVFMQETLNFNVLSADVIRPPDIEDVWVTVQYHILPAFIVGCVYKHPKALAVSFDDIENVFLDF